MSFNDKGNRVVLSDFPERFPFVSRRFTNVNNYLAKEGRLIRICVDLCNIVCAQQVLQVNLSFYFFSLITGVIYRRD